MGDPPRRIEISWVQAVAGALAAVSSAVLLSTVGVAGTVIGAALGSVAATVGSAVYSHYLAASRDRVAAAAAARSYARRVQADPTVTGAEVRPEDVDEVAGETAAEAGGADGANPWHEAVRGLRWRRIVVTAGVLFVAAMSAILTFELVAGRAVSTYTGGSDADGPRLSVPGAGGSDERGQTPSPSPSRAVAPSESVPAVTRATPSAAASTGSGPGPSTPPASPSTSASSALPTGPSSSPVPSG